MTPTPEDHEAAAEIARNCKHPTYDMAVPCLSCIAAALAEAVQVALDDAMLQKGGASPWLRWFVESKVRVAVEKEREALTDSIKAKIAAFSDAPPVFGPGASTRTGTWTAAIQAAKICARAVVDEAVRARSQATPAPEERTRMQEWGDAIKGERWGPPETKERG